MFSHLTLCLQLDYFLPLIHNMDLHLGEAFLMLGSSYEFLLHLAHLHVYQVAYQKFVRFSLFRKSFYLDTHPDNLILQDSVFLIGHV
jgi:hypothetical protein